MVKAVRTSWSFPFIAVSAIVAVALLAGCATLRKDFTVQGEDPLLGKSLTESPYSWQVFGQSDERAGDDKTFAITPEKERTVLRFLNPGGAGLTGSLTGDFRLEFAVRLDAPVEYEIATAMVNFRNFLNKRYCLVIEPNALLLCVARVRHNELEELRRYSVQTGTGAWYRYEIVARGDTIWVFRSGRLLFKVVDTGSDITEGNIWFESHSKYSCSDVALSRITGFEKAETKVAPPTAAAPKIASGSLPLAFIGLRAQGIPSYEAALYSDLYAAALVSTKAFSLCNRADLDRIMTEQEFQLSGLTDDSGAVRVGKLLNAEYLATGSIGSAGGSYVLSVALIRVETGVTVAAARRVFAENGAIPAGIGDIAAELAAKARF